MDKNMASALDRHITGNYGEDQFKGPKNDELNWKIGDIWNAPGQEKYILARMNDPHIHDRYYTQLIGMKTGNRYSSHVIVREDHKEPNPCLFSISEISTLIYGYDISVSTTDEDNVRLDELENCHEYGLEWE